MLLKALSMACCVLAVMRSRKRFAIDHHLRGALPYHLRPPTGHSNGGPFEDSPSSCHYLLEILSAQKLEQRQEQRRAQEQRPGAAARALAGARFSGRQTKKAAELDATFGNAQRNWRSARIVRRWKLHGSVVQHEEVRQFQDGSMVPVMVHTDGKAR